jgi:hypothetical protein
MIACLQVQILLDSNIALVEESPNISEELTVKQIEERWSRIKVISEDSG